MKDNYQDEHDTGTWIFVRTSSGNFFGRVINSFGDATVPRIPESNQIVNADCIVLGPVYGFEDSQEGVPFRLFPVSPTNSSRPPTVYVPGIKRGTCLQFLNDMDPKDVSLCKKLARDIRNSTQLSKYNSR